MALAKSKIKQKKAKSGTGNTGARGRKRTKPLDQFELEEAQKIVRFGGTDRDLALKFRLSPEAAEQLFIDCQKISSANRQDFLETAERRYILGKKLVDRIQETTLIPLSREAIMGIAEDLGVGLEYQLVSLETMTHAYQAMIPVGMGSVTMDIDPANVFEKDGFLVTRLFGAGPEDFVQVFPDNRTRLEALKLLSKNTGLESASKFSIMESAKALRDAEEAMGNKDSGVAYEIVAQPKEPLPEENWADADTDSAP